MFTRLVLCLLTRCAPHHCPHRKAPSGKADSGPLTPAEIARRHRQRELAKLATKLRAEGKEYKRKGPKNKPKIRSKGKIQVMLVGQGCGRIGKGVGVWYRCLDRLPNYL